MKKVRSFLCLAMALILFTASLPIADFVIDANAATTINYSPNPKVEYSYSTGVSAGTIRYISQINGSTYFNSIYWGSWANQAGIECGTASISMSLSYIGIDKTPKTILDVNSGITYFTGWGVDTKSYSYDNLGKSFDNYINGKGKYSPPIIHLNNYSSAGHFVVLIGRISNNQYAVLDPANATVWSITINGASAQYTHPSNARYINDSIDRSNRADDIYQYYNPSASIPSSAPATIIKTSYPSHCTIKVTENDKNIMSLPCSNKTNSKSDKVESAPKGTTYEAIGLILNTEDNLWYKVKAKNGKEGYIFAGNVSFVSAITSDITGPGISVPSNHTHGKTYVLTGSVNSSYNELTNVSAYIYSGSNRITGGTASVNGKSYSLGRSAIDNQTEFNKLAVGQYTYKVTASYKSYYAKTDKTYGTKTGTVNVYSQAFNVVSGSVSPTVPQQPTTIIYPNNEGIYKIASGVGNNMYLDFACTNDNVQIYENCDGHSNSAFVISQYFKLTHIGDGWYSIINIGNGKAMDVYCANSKPETNIHQWEYDGNNAQLFRFYDAGNGYCYIQSKLGCYADVQNGDCVNNTNVWTYIFNGSNAQKWKLELHTHSYIAHYEADHPHRVYKKCKCGDWYYTGDTQTVYSCSACLPEEPTTEISEEPTTEISNDTNSGSNPVPTIRKGDIDNDGRISASDARLTLRASVGLEKFNIELTKKADVDKDNKISASDARLILRASVGLENTKSWT